MNLINLSIPIFIDLFLHFITLVINTYMVSKVDLSLVAAMGSGNQIMDFFISIFEVLSIGVCVVISQAIGAKNNDFAQKSIDSSLTFNIFFVVIFSYVIFNFSTNILNLLNIPSNLIKPSEEYLRLLGIALVFEVVIILLAAILRVYGYANSVMFGSLIMNVISIIGNAIALFSWFGLPNFGLFGVAIATITGRIVALLFLLYVMIKKVKIKPKIYINLKALKSILKVGLPGAGEKLLFMGQHIVVLSFIGKLGSVSLGVHNIYFQLTLLMLLFGASISLANEIIVGIFIGAKEYEKSYKHTFKSLYIGLAGTLIVSLIFYLSRNIITSDFNDEFKQIMLPLFVLSIFLECCRTFNIVIVNALRASGDANFPLFTAFIFMWGLSLPLGYFLGIYLELGVLGIWLGFLADEFIRGIINTLRYKNKKWQQKLS